MTRPENKSIMLWITVLILDHPQVGNLDVKKSIDAKQIVPCIGSAHCVLTTTKKKRRRRRKKKIITEKGKKRKEKSRGSERRKGGKEDKRRKKEKTVRQSPILFYQSYVLIQLPSFINATC